MSFWNKIKDSLRRFMIGRNGADELSMAMLIFSLVLMILSSITGIALFNLLGTVCYALIIFRMFSRNLEKRYAENQKYVAFRTNAKTAISQWKVRLKNSKKYKYFKCPECKALLRLPRNVGEVTVTCGKCRHAFKKKA